MPSYVVEKVANAFHPSSLFFSLDIFLRIYFQKTFFTFLLGLLTYFILYSGNKFCKNNNNDDFKKIELLSTLGKIITRINNV